MLEKMQNEIYFHRLLKARRKMMGATLQNLAKGICSASTIYRMERDELAPEKMVRDRIIARLGISGEKYEDYLPPEEYKRWMSRQDILKNIRIKQLLYAEDLLKRYAESAPKKSIERQFVATMKFMIAQMKNAPIFEQRLLIEEAVKETITMTGDTFSNDLLLAEQEINLLIEYVSLHGTGVNEKDVFEWRLGEYRKIMEYIEQSQMDTPGRSKIYPKVVYCWMKLVSDYYKADASDIPKEIVEYGLKICNKAIELLRDTMKLFYFIELLEVRMVFIHEKLKYTIGKEAQELKELLETTTTWHQLFMKLYTEYDVSPYMEHFCHLYWEMKSYPMGEVVKTRRKMKGMTKEELSDETCDLKSITRCERQRAKTQKYTIRDIFPKVGLGIENIGCGVVTNDYDTLEVYLKMQRCVNLLDFEEWEKCICELEQRLQMDIPENKQVIDIERNGLLQCKNMISNKELQVNIISSLKNTMPLENILNCENCYITQKELVAIYEIAKEAEEKEKYYTLLRNVFEGYEEVNGITPNILQYEFIMTEISSWMGDIGRYDESSELSRCVIRESLIHRRIGVVGPNYYAILWNTHKKFGWNMIVDKNALQECKFLCDIAKIKNWVTFLVDKIEHIDKKKD